MYYKCPKCDNESVSEFFTVSTRHPHRHYGCLLLCGFQFGIDDKRFYYGDENYEYAVAFLRNLKSAAKIKEMDERLPKT
jgi:hypothetical protein